MERGNSSLKLNMVLNAVFKLSSLLFPLITFSYVSRALLPEGVGKVISPCLPSWEFRHTESGLVQR